MAEVKETITLSSSDGCYITDSTGYYRVEKGTINAYIAPIENGRPVNRK